jgi:cyclohexadieny/prephenate dehydrogenase
MNQPLFERLTVIGLGLIGSSLARRAMQYGTIAREVVAYDASPAVRARVAELGIVHRVADTEQEAVQDADCVLLCVPVGAMAASAAAIIPYMRTGAILTDVGSTKQSVIREIQPLLRPDLHFVPAHPIAGT